MVSDMMTAEQLKNSILQLALSGKLVPQDKTDEPAQILLKRIREKKKALIKAKVVPKDKNMDNVSEDEQLFDIPDNWIWTRIGELFQHNTGKALNGSNKEGTVLPYITTSNLYWNRFELDNLKEMPFTDAEIEKCTATKGDLLVCEGGDYGRAAIWNYDFDIRIQNHVHKLRAYEELCTEYFYYLFNFLKSTGQIKGKGIAIQGLSSGALHNLVVPLPPLNEQYRIVEKIHEIIPVWEQYATASTKLNTLNATFPEMMKKSILQEAVQGKLVPQDPNDEPASLLLKKIAEEKKRLIKEGKIKKDKNTSRIVREGNSWFEFADGQKTCIDEEIPFEIPDNWSWVRLNELGDYKKGPFGSALTKSMFVPAGPNSIKVYEQKNAIQKDWTLGEYYIRKEYYEEKMSGFTVEGGDVIVSCAGTIGETYVMPDDIELGIINQALMRMKVYEPMNVDYFLMYFDYVIKATAREQSKGSAIKNIPPFAIFKRILFPMPPLSEQDRILSRLTEILLEVDKMG